MWGVGPSDSLFGSCWTLSSCLGCLGLKGGQSDSCLDYTYIPLVILNSPQMPWDIYANVTFDFSGSCRRSLSQDYWKEFVPDTELLQAVTVNLTCQFDLKNQLGDDPLDVPVERLFWLGLLRWEEPCTMGSTIPWAEDPGLYKKEKMNWT